MNGNAGLDVTPATVLEAQRMDAPLPTPTLPPGPLEPDLKFAAAFAKAQSEYQPVRRSKEVVVRLSSGNSYTFRYAPLDAILAAILPALNQNGFALTQSIGKGVSGDYIETTLLHAAGAHRANKTPIFITSNPTAQVYASGMTYARRYGVTLLCCVAAEEDDDANAAVGNEAKVSDRAPPAKGKKGERAVVLDPGETRHDTIQPAFPAGSPQSSWVDKIPNPVPTGVQGQDLEVPEGDALIRAEGRVVDAVAELVEAAAEGRAVGIRQIWDEIKTDEYVATMTWRKLKAHHPDQFATVNALLRADKAAANPPRPRHGKGDK